MKTTATPPNGRTVMERFWAAASLNDTEQLVSLVHPDIEVSWPQSGERFRGRENALAAMEATDEKPEVAGEPRLVGSGDLWVAMVPLRYGEEIYRYVGVFELERGLVRRSTEYFAAPFPANPARAAFTVEGGGTGG